MRLSIILTLALVLTNCTSIRNGNGLMGNKASCPSYPVQVAPNVIEFRDVENDGCP